MMEISKTFLASLASTEQNIRMFGDPVDAARVRQAMQMLGRISPSEVHPDDIAVNMFAAELKQKMAASRAKGRGGWDDPKQCTIESLAAMLVQHVAKGDPVDIGNFAMMLHMRGIALTTEHPCWYDDVVRAICAAAISKAKESA